jgi:hypothetical protein
MVTRLNIMDIDGGGRIFGAGNSHLPKKSYTGEEGDEGLK